MARPVVGVVSRLVEQKGIDLLAAANDDLFDIDATWIFVGRGEPRFEQFLRQLAAKYPARAGVFIGFDEALAHLVEAGADMFLMPSRFEPCGLNQMYSLRYGTVPIVHAVGGLDDTVRHYTPRARHANGFKFTEATPEALTRVAAAGRAGVSRPRAVAGADARGHGGGSLLEKVGPGICQSVQTGSRRGSDPNHLSPHLSRSDRHDGCAPHSDVYRRQL